MRNIENNNEPKFLNFKKTLLKEVKKIMKKSKKIILATLLISSPLTATANNQNSQPQHSSVQIKSVLSNFIEKKPRIENYSPVQPKNFTPISPETTDPSNLSIDEIKTIDNKILQDILDQLQRMLEDEEENLAKLAISQMNETSEKDIEKFEKFEEKIQHIRELIAEIFVHIPILTPLSNFTE